VFGPASTHRAKQRVLVPADIDAASSAACGAGSGAVEREVSRAVLMFATVAVG